MTFADPTANPTEETMSAAAAISDATTPRYGYAPQVMFAATRAVAEQKARARSTATAPDTAPRPAWSLIRRLATLFATSRS